MADTPKKESSVLRTPDGIFYKIPNDVLKEYAVPPEELKDVLSDMKKGPGPAGGSGPGGGPRQGGGPFVINVNLGEAIRSMMPGGQGQPAAAGAGAVAGYRGCGHSCYRSCYSSCYSSCR